MADDAAGGTIKVFIYGIMEILLNIKKQQGIEAQERKTGRHTAKRLCPPVYSYGVRFFGSLGLNVGLQSLQ